MKRVDVLREMETLMLMCVFWRRDRWKNTIFWVRKHGQNYLFLSLALTQCWVERMQGKRFWPLTRCVHSTLCATTLVSLSPSAVFLGKKSFPLPAGWFGFCSALPCSWGRGCVSRSRGAWAASRTWSAVPGCGCPTSLELQLKCPMSWKPSTWVTITQCWQEAAVKPFELSWHTRCCASGYVMNDF